MLFDPKNLAAGIKELRATAKRLNAWADDLEKVGASASSVPDESPPAAEPAAAPLVVEPAPVAAVPAVKPAAAPAPSVAKSPVPPVPTAPYDTQAVKKFLVFVCSRGYSNQVKALIASYGVKILSDVPAEAYGDIVQTMLPMYESAVEELNAEAAGGDSNEA